MIPFVIPMNTSSRFDFLLLERLEAEAVLDQPLGEEAAVLVAVLERARRGASVFGSSFDRLDLRECRDLLRRLVVAVAPTDTVNTTLPRTLRIAASTSPLKSSLPRSMMPILLQMSASSGRMWLRDQDRLAHVAQLLEQLAHLDAGPRVEAAGRLVEQQHLRVVQQHAGQAEPLRHAARQARDQGVALVAEVDQLEHLVAASCAAPGP